MSSFHLLGRKPNLYSASEYTIKNNFMVQLGSMFLLNLRNLEFVAFPEAELQLCGRHKDSYLCWDSTLFTCECKSSSCRS